jgi:phosphoglycerol transferase
VFIYMEGLEQAYFDVPGLMPHLSSLRSQVLTFTNIHELVGGTIGGIIGSQCGWPPFTDQALYKEEKFYPGLTCLGDLLKEQGYHSIYMGGASVRFTRKDTLFGTHGFSEVLGNEQLKERLPDPTYLNKWGLHDDSLFDIARDVFDDLSAREGPFSLVLLTLGTHVPGYLAASCPSFHGSEHVVVQAAHCTDKLVAEFVTYVRGSRVSDHTVIALMSDHLMWKGVEDQGLNPAPGSRRLTFMLDLPGEAGRETDVRGSELDVAATLAAVLDLSFGDRIGLGSSLLTGDGFLWTPESGLESLAAIRSFVRSNEVRAFMAEARQQPVDEAPTSTD